METRHSPDQFVWELEVLVQKLHNWPNFSIVVSSILPCPGQLLRAEIDRGNSLIAALCERYGPNVRFCRSCRGFMKVQNEDHSYVVCTRAI